MAAARPEDDFDEETDDLTSTLVPTLAPQPPDPNDVLTREEAAEDGNYVWYNAAPWTHQGKEMYIGDFDMINSVLIGTGQFGTIRKVLNKKSGKIVALKECNKQVYEDRNIVSWVMNERYALARLNSPYVIKLLAAFQSHSTLYFVLEYMPNGDLSKLIKKYAPFHFLLCRHYSAEMTAGLDYLRESFIIHRDLKPQNILLDREFHIKIADFGNCTTMAPIKNRDRKGIDDNLLPTPMSKNTGTPLYRPPEMYNKELQSFGSDLWSLGCIIFEMYTGKRCFDNPTDIPAIKASPRQLDMINNAVRANIVAGIHTPWPHPPEEVVQDLINKLLKRDPNQRIGMHPRWRVTALKAHNFFNGINWPKLHLTPPPLPIPQLSQPPHFDITADEQHPEMVAIRSCKEDPFITAKVTSHFLSTSRSGRRSTPAPEGGQGQLPRDSESLEASNTFKMLPRSRRRPTDDDDSAGCRLS